MQENFDDPKSGWEAGADSGAEWGYRDGEYRVVANAKDTAVWGSPQPARDWADFSLEVDARLMEGPLDNELGVAVRIPVRAGSPTGRHGQPDGKSMYLFAISSDGSYVVRMLRNEEWEYLAKWTQSAALRQGKSVNHLRVECRGPRMQFWANGQLLVEVQDATLRSGNVGLLAAAFAEPGVVVHFDNLRIETLGP
jgi:hypothetical protein